MREEFIEKGRQIDVEQVRKGSVGGELGRRSPIAVAPKHFTPATNNEECISCSCICLEVDFRDSCCNLRVLSRSTQTRCWSGLLSRRPHMLPSPGSGTLLDQDLIRKFGIIATEWAPLSPSLSLSFKPEFRQSDSLCIEISSITLNLNSNLTIESISQRSCPHQLKSGSGGINSHARAHNAQSSSQACSSHWRRSCGSHRH